jgi:hypothetical protein
VTLAVLHELGFLDEAEMGQLTEFTAGILKNYAGQMVGEGRICFELERVGR